MSLAPGEQETLTEIENSLCRSDPSLAAMFTDFSRHIFGRQGPVRESLSPWRPGLRRTVGVILVIVTALGAMCVVLAIVLANHGAPVPVSHIMGFTHSP